MKNNKKRFAFFRKYTTIMVCALLIPSIVAIGQYIFSIEYVFHNEYYSGEELEVDDS